MPDFLSFTKHLAWPIYAIGIFGVVGLLCILFIDFCHSRKKSREKRKLSYILQEFGEIKTLGKLQKGKAIFVCPTCFLLSPTERLCPNHAYPVQMKIGKFDALEYYNRQQQLLRTEVPDDDDGKDKKPWE